MTTRTSPGEQYTGAKQKGIFQNLLPQTQDAPSLLILQILIMRLWMMI